MDVATALSTTDHGGTFIATGTTTVGGQNVLTVGDAYTCSNPTHTGTNVILTGSTVTKDLNGKYMARAGLVGSGASVTTCGATIITGNPTLQLTG
jgi:uncharacterized Zn-binding protein involved in type VI secretion